MRTKNETSAGGIVYRKNKGVIEILVLKDHNNNWTFPKGLIEDKEEAILTAKREIAEEVGIDNIKYVASLGKVNYYYTFEDTRVYKTVYYYIFELIGSNFIIKPQKEEGIQEAKFVELSKAQNIIGYKKTNVPILKKAEKYFQENFKI